MPEDDDDRKTTLRWKIGKEIELYQFYLDVSIKAAVFLMATTGAIASYVLSKSGIAIINYVLAFPAVVNGGFAFLFYSSIKEAKQLAEDHIAASIELKVPEVNMNPLQAICKIFCVMCALAAAGLLILMVFRLMNPGSLAKT